MASVYYEPFHSFIEETFSGHHNNHGQYSINRGEGDSAVRSFKPRMDVHEDARKNLVTASFEFPGLSKNDVQISIHNGRLVVEADTKKSTETENVDSEKGYYVVRERWVGRLWRSLQLPLGIKEDQIKASMKDGVLNIAFPKTTPERTSSRIAVN